MKRNLSVDIKTNAGWVGTNMEKRIYDDLNATIRANPNARSPQISLSLDKYHPNAMDKNVRFIQAMALRNTDIVFHLSGFGAAAFERDIDKLIRVLNSKRNIRMQSGYILPKPADGDTPNMDMAQPIIKANNARIIWTVSPSPRAAGRGVELAACEPDIIPCPDDAKFRVFEDDMLLINVVEQGGNFRLGEANPTNITAPWRNADGTDKTLADARRDIFREMRRAELKFMAQKRCFMISHRDAIMK